MLLTTLIELLASKFNIQVNDITHILTDNNIRMDQRLLLERGNNKALEKTKDNKVITSNTITSNTIVSNTIASNTIVSNTNTSNTITSNTNTSNTITSNTITSNVIANEFKADADISQPDKERAQYIVEKNVMGKDKVTKNTQDQETKPVRGRGRPRKQRVSESESEVCVEVEEVILEGGEYYKTCENVILSKSLEIEGILRDGKLIRKKEK